MHSFMIALVVLMMLSSNVARTNSTAVNFKQEMRTFVHQISEFARKTKPNFIIIPQNGNEIVTTDGEPDGPLDMAYLNAIDGLGREDLFYGYEDDNEATPQDDIDWMLPFLQRARDSGKTILSTDYCWQHSKIDDSYAKNAQESFISFAALVRELSTIPDYPVKIYGQNQDDIEKLSDAKNFLYIISDEEYSELNHFLNAIQNTNYDVVLIDAYFHDHLMTTQDLAHIRTKKDGGKRLVIAYMSIGEAETYRWYWHHGWTTGNPSFVAKDNPDWCPNLINDCNYLVKYWVPEWKCIIMDYTQKLVDAGFDGTYLDIIDAFDFFENDWSQTENAVPGSDNLKHMSMINDVNYTLNERIHKKCITINEISTHYV